MNNELEKLYESIYDVEITSLRLSDGSYIIVEEIDFDEEINVLYVSSPVSLVADLDGGNYRLKEWMLFAEDEIVEISGNHIISRSETPIYLKKAYMKFRFLKVLHDQQDNSLPPVDNETISDMMTKKLKDIYKNRQGLN